MWNKIVISLVAIFVLFGSTMSLMTKAVGVDTALKIVAGTQTKQIVRGIAEEVGLELSTKHFDNVVGQLNDRANDGDVKVLEWIDKTKVINPAPEPSTKGTGWKKYVLDPVLWVTGADLILEAIDAFNDGYANGTPVEVWEDGALSGKETYKNTITVIPKSNADALYYFTWSSDGQPHVDSTNYVRVSDPGNYILYYYNGYGDPITESQKGSLTSGDFNITWALAGTTYQGYSSGSVKSKTVIADDYYDYSTTNISTQTKTNYDNDTYYNQVKTDNSDTDVSNDVITYKMDLDLPDDTSDTKTKDMSTFWNVEDSTITGGTFYVFDSGGGDVTIGDGSGSGSGSTINNTNDIDINFGEVTDPVQVPRNFFTSLTYMGEKVGEMYDGVTSFLTKAVDGMKELTLGTVGFVAFIDDFFDWLPSEYKALLGIGFTLGVTSFFLRR